jgi:hypothetical protein
MAAGKFTRSQRKKPFRADGAILPMRVWKQFAKSGAHINGGLLKAGKGDLGSILIEGNKAGLEYIANLILAVAGDEDCGYGLSPLGPGSAAFGEDAPLGIYIHRLPCVNAALGGNPGISSGGAGRRHSGQLRKRNSE